MKKKLALFLRIFLTLAVIAWTTWVFSNSLKNSESSSQQSQKVVEIVEQVTGVKCSHKVIRKSAHFLEFTVLGALWTLTYFSYGHRGAFCLALAEGTSVLTAVCDETLQRFSKGRSPQSTDVLIDSAGALFGVCFVGGILFLVWLCKRKKKKTEG